MKLGEKIGEGRHRECWTVEGRPDLCAKTVREKPIRPIGLDVPVLAVLNSVVTRVHEQMSAPRDPNQREVDVIEMLKAIGFDKYLPREVRLEPNNACRPILVMSRPIDYDEQYSKTIFEHGPVHNQTFWKHVDQIIRLMLDSDFCMFDVFHYGQNVLVHKVSEREYVPVIVDFKRLGADGYPFQINLWLKSERKRKLLRRLKAFKQRFMPAELLQNL